MEKKVKINDRTYILINNYKDGFDLNETNNKYTEYFDDYDYIVGDWSYGKLRLKGFCEKDNPLFNEINNYETIDTYIKENCAYECKYFVANVINCL